MMEMVVFALVIVAAQVMAGLIAMVISLKLMLNKKFMLKYCKKYMKIMEDVNEELLDELLKDEAQKWVSSFIFRENNKYCYEKTKPVSYTNQQNVKQFKIILTVVRT